MAGTDNTRAINSALKAGEPVSIPAGDFYYAGAIKADVTGSGLVGEGSQASRLITDRSLDRHIVVTERAARTTWSHFTMVGPYDFRGNALNRALTIGVDSSGAGLAADNWDASGTWVDDLVTTGFCTGVHIAADNVRFGTIEVNEVGDSRSEPGSYGITCSGSKLRGALLRVTNRDTRGRHALYYTGPANDCFVDVVEARGFDFAAVQNRATKGGGRRNGFGRGRFEDCNTNTTGAETLRGVVNFGCANDVVVKGAGEALIGDYEAIACGGFPGPSLRNMPRSLCGTVRVFGHSGTFMSEHYGAHIYRSDDVRLPRLEFVSGYGSSGLNDSTFQPLVVDESRDCYGGGVTLHAGAVFSIAPDR